MTDDEERIETINDHLVGTNGQGISINLPPFGSMPKEETLRLAAWLVMCADYGELDRFNQIFDAIRKT